VPSFWGHEQTEEGPRADREHVSGTDVADVVSEVLLLEAALQTRVREAEPQETRPDSE